MKSAPIHRILTTALAAALVAGSTVAAGSSATAAGCDQVTLTLRLDRSVDFGTVTGRWGAYSATLTHAANNTTAPFFYSGDIVVPLSAYTGWWGYSILVGADPVFDSGTIGSASLGGTQACSLARSIFRAAGGLSIRVFHDPSGAGSDPGWDEWTGDPLEQPMTGVPVHLCALPATGTECIAGTESAFGSPKIATDGEYEVYFSGIEGRFKVWEQAPAGWLQTYPRASSTATDCGAWVNVCTPYPGFWTIAGGVGPLHLEFGNFDRHDCGRLAAAPRPHGPVASALMSPCASVRDR